jgi:hypothetical protein
VCPINFHFSVVAVPAFYLELTRTRNTFFGLSLETLNAVRKFLSKCVYNSKIEKPLSHFPTPPKTQHSVDNEMVRKCRLCSCKIAI